MSYTKDNLPEPSEAEIAAMRLKQSLEDEQRQYEERGTLFRFEDSDGWRWYAESESKFKDGECYISVTKVLDTVVHEKLKAWYVNNSKKAIEKKSTETADVGTAIHELIRCDLSGLPYEVDETLKAPFEQWLKLKETHKITAYSTESFVHSELGFAGTADIQGYFDGKKAVMDIKTGSYNIKAGWQLAAYRQAIFEKTGEWVGMVGLHIKRDGSVGTPFVYEHFDFCWKAFESALFCWKALYFTKLNKMKWKYLHK